MGSGNRRNTSSWFADETYVKVAGRWRYLDRAVDQHGQVIDVLLSARRDLAAARRFFTRALRAGPIPAEVTTDRASELSTVFNFVSYPGAPSGTDAYVKQSVLPGCFANGLPASEAAVLAATQRPLATNAFTDPSGTPAWATIPSWDIVGMNDHIITPAEQLFMAHRAHAHITEVGAPYLSMISNPWAVASVIIQAAKATG